MSLAPLPDHSTAELVAQRLRDAILEGHLRSGDRLIEADIAADLGVSRGPVREGIRLLVADGVAELRRNRGAVVFSPTLDDVLEVYVLRFGLGLLALSHGINTGMAKDPRLSDVDVLLERLRDPQVQADPVLMMDADLRFQSALFERCDLSRVNNVLDQTARDIPVFVRLLGITYDTVDHADLISRHQGLVGAIRRSDRDAALDAWRSHIRISVGEFARGYPDGDVREIFERPLTQHIFDHHTPARET